LGKATGRGGGTREVTTRSLEQLLHIFEERWQSGLMQRSSSKGRFAPGFLINFLPASEVRILPSPLLVLASNYLLEEATGNPLTFSLCV
jgi:hypothetical protein